jgi:hypothetical protein
MNGRVKKKKIADHTHYFSSKSNEVEALCQLCMRPTTKSQRDNHHLIPKSYGGVETIILHKLCHQQIHALLTESQLARNYSTIENLKSHPEISKFIDWVRKKPSHVHAAIKKSRDKGFL